MRQAHQLRPSPAGPFDEDSLTRSRLDDPESQIGQLLGLAEADPFELDPFLGFAAEQADAPAEQYWSNVEHDLIEQTGVKAPASKGGA